MASCNSITINNTTTDATVGGSSTLSALIPPVVALNFGTLATVFNNMVPQSSEPTNPVENDVYLDDGTNTTSGTLGFRRYTGSVWEDFGLQTVAGTTTLGDLSDVTITTIVDGERLEYDSSSGEWINQGTIDGGSFVS